MLVFLFIAVYFIVSTKDIIEFPKVFQRNEVLLHSELNKVLKNNWWCFKKYADIK